MIKIHPWLLKLQAESPRRLRYEITFSFIRPPWYTWVRDVRKDSRRSAPSWATPHPAPTLLARASRDSSGHALQTDHTPLEPDSPKHNHAPRGQATPTLQARPGKGPAHVGPAFPGRATPPAPPHHAPAPPDQAPPPRPGPAHAAVRALPELPSTCSGAGGQLPGCPRAPWERPASEVPLSRPPRSRVERGIRREPGTSAARVSARPARPGTRSDAFRRRPPVWWPGLSNRRPSAERDGTGT